MHVQETKEATLNLTSLQNNTHVGDLYIPSELINRFLGAAARIEQRGTRNYSYSHHDLHLVRDLLRWAKKNNISKAALCTNLNTIAPRSTFPWLGNYVLVKGEAILRSKQTAPVRNYSKQKVTRKTADNCVTIKVPKGVVVSFTNT